MREIHRLTSIEENLSSRVIPYTWDKNDLWFFCYICNKKQKFYNLVTIVDDKTNYHKTCNQCSDLLIYFDFDVDWLLTMAPNSSTLSD